MYNAEYKGIKLQGYKRVWCSEAKIIKVVVKCRSKLDVNPS